MLLVAMLALGTATFAWFTQNTAASASGIYAKTVKASTLEISKANKAWGTVVTYTQGASGDGNAQVMFPASSDDGANWVEALSENATTGAYKGSGAKSVTPSGTNAKFVYSEMLNVRNAGATGAPAINSVSIAWSWPEESSDYIRLALVPCNAEGTTFTAANFRAGVFGKNDTQYNGLTLEGAGEAITPKTATSLSVGTLTAGQEAYYKLFVWFEGQDANCVDAKAGQTLDGLTFSITGTPAAN